MDDAGPSNAPIQPTEAPAAAPAVPLSKNAQKRALRAAAAAETKTERRRLEKARRKARAAQRRQEAQAAGETLPPSRKQLKLPQSKKTLHGAGVCIDLAFDELMTSKEIVSLTSQLTYLYSSHRLAANSFRHILFSGPGSSGLSSRALAEQTAASYGRAPVPVEQTQDLHGRPLEETLVGKRMVEAWKWENWLGTQRVLNGGLEGLLLAPGETSAAPGGSTGPEAGPSQTAPASAPTTSGESSAPSDASAAAPPSVAAEADPQPPRFAPHDVVYLTPDTDDTLDALEDGKLYVIGGIVDRNRHKHLCLERAKALGVRVARLPIDFEHLGERALAPRAVLTVNQVFDILLGWLETREWGAALDRGLPSRKQEREGRAERRAAKRAAARQMRKGSEEEAEEDDSDALMEEAPLQPDEEDEEEAFNRARAAAAAQNNA